MDDSGCYSDSPMADGWDCHSDFYQDFHWDFPTVADWDSHLALHRFADCAAANFYLDLAGAAPDAAKA
jgi:hypothetical protein